ncbi:hypothetical protein VE18_03320 [Enterobacter hormaechei]|nr:hypothetical protein VE18_03320 [Enterobacter hormaechei]
MERNNICVLIAMVKCNEKLVRKNLKADSVKNKLIKFYFIMFTNDKFGLCISNLSFNYPLPLSKKF